MRPFVRLVALSTAAVFLAAADAPPAATPAAPAATPSTAPPATPTATPAASASATAALPPDVVAKRGDLQLTVGDISHALSLIDPGMRAQIIDNPQALLNFVKERVVRQILLSQAHDAKWDQNPEIVAKANEARDTAIVQLWLASKAPVDPGYPSEAELQGAYEANKARFAVPAQFHLQQIAILIPPGASKEAQEAAHKKAREVRAQVTKPKADFTAIARAESQDPGSKANGGDLGWVREDQILKQVRDVVVGMTPNSISEPILGSDSWHVVKLVEVHPASTAPLEQVKGNLIQAMRQAKAQQQTSAYIQSVLKAEPVVLDDQNLASRLTPAK